MTGTSPKGINTAEKKKMLILSVILLIILLISVLGVIRIMMGDGKARKKVIIEQDGKVVREVDITSSETAEDIVVDTPDGGRNVIRMEKGEVWMAEANCPDQLCVHQGRLVSGSLPIVCMPHKVVVRYADE